VKGTTVSDLLENYLACWNETDPAARRALLEAHWAVDATYTDPLAEVAGQDALDAAITAVQTQFPGWVFAPGGQFDAHHQQARFTWTLGPAGADAPVAGFDVVMTDADGRISPSSASSTGSRPRASPSHPVWSNSGLKNRPHRVTSGGLGLGAVQGGSRCSGRSARTLGW
jgi:hypothetical protein